MSFNLDKKIYYFNIFLLLTISVIIIYLLYQNSLQQKTYIINDAKNKTETLARFVNSDINRFIFGVEELMEGIHNAEEHIEHNPEHHNEIESLLRKNLRPYIMDILIVNPQSEIIHWTQEGTKPNIKDREYITFHLSQSNSNVTYIGKPQLSRVHKNKWFFAVSKAYYHENKLENIVVMILDLAFFNNRYKNSLPNNNATIFIAANSGEIYTRFPYKKEDIGKQLKEIADFSKLRIESKHFDIPSPLDNQARIASLVQSQNYPIVTGSSLLTSDVLVPWEKQKNITAIITSIISFGFIILIIYYTKLQFRLVQLSQEDSLTKLYNRGYFTYHSNNEFFKAQRYNEPLAIIMLDIDDFKMINDTKGHKAGDKVIKILANCIKNSIREIDLAGRYGGEEFVILLVQSDVNAAKKVAQRIQDAFINNEDNQMCTTASFGVSSFQQGDENVEEIIHRADMALYSSKHAGKNRITIS